MGKDWQAVQCLSSRSTFSQSATEPQRRTGGVPIYKLFVSILTWATISIGLLLITFTDFALKLEIAGVSLTSLLLLFAVSLISLGLLIILVSNFRIPRNFQWVPGSPATSRLGLYPFVFSGFLLLVHQLAGGLANSSELVGLQRILSSILFVLTIIFFAYSKPPSELVLKSIWWAGLIGSTLVLISSSTGVELFGTRHSAMFFLVPLAVGLTVMRFNAFNVVFTILILSSIFSTSSRTSSALALTLLLIATLVKERSLFQKLSVLGFGALTFLYFIVLIPSFRDRFLSETGDRAISLASLVPEQSTLSESVEIITINSNGRVAVWQHLFSASLESNTLWGNGAGWAHSIVSEEFGWDHPHNEYLRLLADHGIVGLSLLLIMLSTLAIYFLSRMKPLNRQSVLGISSVYVVSVLSITDLPLVSLATFLPAAIAIGVAISSIRQTAQTENQTHK